MKWTTGIGAVAGIVVLAGSALAQPTITSLGNGSPVGVSNLTGGNYYISGAGIVSSTNPAQVGRWTFNPGAATLSAAELGLAPSFNPVISSDGAFLMGTSPNTSPQVLGVTATGVSPPFSTTPTLVPGTAPLTTELIVNRWSASSSTWTRAAVIPTETRLCYGQSAGGVTMMTFGPGGNSAGSAFQDGNAISQNGRFVVGYSYISSYSAAAGTAIAASTSRWLPYVWDAQTNTTTVLPTAARTSSNTWRPRTARAYAVSNDGLVVVGYQEHNVSSSLAADPDGSRPLVWRWNSGTSKYDMSYLPTGTNAGLVYTASSTGQIYINAAGTIIAGRNVDNLGNSYICKWTWDSGSSTWNTTNLGTNVGANFTVDTITCPAGVPRVTTLLPHGLNIGDRVQIFGNTTTAYNGTWRVTLVPTTTTFEISGPDDSPKACATDGTGGTVWKTASWLPFAVYMNCGAPSFGAGAILAVSGMSDDGNTVIGTANYGTCGSFQQGGWIWHNSDGIIQDWYDYCVAQGVPTVGTNLYYGPIGDNGDFTKGMPRLGAPLGINPDGTAIIGKQGGTTIIVPSAGSWIMVPSGGATCVAPQIVTQPFTTLNNPFSLCSSSGVIINMNASGTAPLTYQWYKNTGGGPVAINDGGTGNGSTITGTTSIQLRIANPRNTDAGTYTCIVTGCSGQTVTSNGLALTADATQATPANNDCAFAVSMGESTVNWNICAAWANQGSSCSLDLASVWYRYTPTFTGNARFQTCASTFDTTIQLYDMCNGSFLADGCNDDVGPRGLAGLGTASCGSSRSLISSFPVTSGVPIYVRVGAKTFPFSTTNSGVSGGLTISQAPAPPANDLCSNATPVSGNSTTAFNLNEATDDFNIGVSADGSTSFCTPGASQTATASNRDVWFSLNSPCGGTYTISTCGSTITNPMLHVFDGCGSLNLLACNDNVGTGGCTPNSSNQARISNLTITGPVLIRVSQSGTGSPGTAANSGSGNIVITGTDVQCGVCCRGATCNTTITSAVDCTAAAPAGAFFAPVTGAPVCNTVNSTTTPCCYADFNKVGGLSVADIFDFLNAWFAGSPFCQVGGDGTSNLLNVGDIFSFLNAWFAGC